MVDSKEKFHGFVEPAGSSERHQTEEEKELQYIQLKPLSKPVLFPKPQHNGEIVVNGKATNKRSDSSASVLGGVYSSKRSVADDLQPTKEHYSLFCLGPKNPVRRLAINITESRYPFQIHFTVYALLIDRVFIYASKTFQHIQVRV